MTVIVPFKKKKGQSQLSQRRYAFNTWYRATIEHCLAYVKRSAFTRYLRLNAHFAHFAHLVISSQIVAFCAKIVSYRILNTVYRGHIKKGSLYLARALKIIMHSNYVHTRVHPQRMHLPMQLELTDIEALEVPIDPVHGTGSTWDSFDVGDEVQIWRARTWWTGRITYKARAGTFSVRLLGMRDAYTGIQPNQVKAADAIEI